MRFHRRWAGPLALAAVLVMTALTALTGPGAATPAAAASPRVLLVGSFHGHRGQFSSVQAAVHAAKPGDWILIGPGDYHETDDTTTSPTSGALHHGDFGGVVITTSGLHLRGMNRSSVVIDGTKAGAPQACDADPAWQNFGGAANGVPDGRNGIVIWKADNVSVQNLTACNFLAGTGASGNEIWWNGGADSGTVGLHGYSGSYLTATSTFFGPDGTVASAEATAAQYGIFSSNAAGGSWDQIYASNFNDSGTYVGACDQACNMTMDNAWMEYNALGYSGTNSGGALVIENSQFDNNRDGLDTNTEISADPRAPQNGDCPGGKISPITHTRSCWVFIHNFVHDNNNPNVPALGSAAAGPLGTGMTVSGATNDTVMNNRFVHNGAWGILFVPYPDSGTPVIGQTCTGTGGNEIAGFGCVYDPAGDALVHNTFTDDGFFGNPANVDFGELTLVAHQPQNCFKDNTAPQGSVPANLETAQAKCGPLTAGPNDDATLLGQVLCDTGFGSCPAGASYPATTGIVMHPLPKLASMPNPCQGVPSNAWCKAGKPV
ncbi:MAG: hypothetical protein ACRDYB_10400 [Acidimicrobiales bacterium]